MKTLTEKEKEIVNKLNDRLYTVEFLEEWINRKDTIVENAPCALQIMCAIGYYEAIRNMAKLEENQDYVVFLEGVRDRHLNIIQKYSCYVMNDEVQEIINLVKNSMQKVESMITKLKDGDK